MTSSAQEGFGRIESVKILVILNLIGYMLTSSGFDAFIHLSIKAFDFIILFYRFFWNDREFILLKSRWTSTGHFLDSTGSSVTNRSTFSPSPDDDM